MNVLLTIFNYKSELNMIYIDNIKFILLNTVVLKQQTLDKFSAQ